MLGLRKQLVSVVVITCATTLAAGAASVTGPRPVATFPPHLVGSVDAVVDLLQRVLPGSASHFELAIEPRCPGIPAGKACFTLTDGVDETIKITGTSASEITGGIGIYLREHCNMTIGWPRGGGSRIFIPSPWPRIGRLISRVRSVPYSHVTQVCTHSYTLVWHDWEAWEKFIDCK
jgi:alpha-N-acetylglucosaminidase